MEDVTGYHVYDHLAVEPLRRLGWEVDNVAWTDPNADWRRYDVVVIRSTWDYQNKPHAFLKTLEAIEAANVRLLNSSSLCKWNFEKTYLRDLEKRNVPTIPSRWLDRLTAEDLEASFEQFGERIVVKPIVGANADDTFILTRSESFPNGATVLDLYRDKPLIVQPFLESIQTEGEYSLIYFGGRFSHAAQKIPRCGDFRVQEEHGGHFRLVELGPDLLEVGRRTLDVVEEDWLYARVDLVRVSDGQPVVIELELIEPSLYFNLDPESPHRFAKALDEIMT